MKKYIFSLVLGLGALVFIGCDSESGNSIEKRQQAQQTLQAVQSVGMPAISKFTEKKNLKMILELRDNPELHTYTYTKNLNGDMKKLCDSIGFPIPYATQYTNPETTVSDISSASVIPQADPTGLYSPTSAEGSYVMCLNPNGKISPVYVEERLIAAPFPLK